MSPLLQQQLTSL